MSSNASSKNPIKVSPEKKAELYRLTNPPKLAWPTLGLMLYIVVGVVAVDWAALGGYIPLWAGTLLNIVALWPVFHVAHDALHRAASSNVTLNDWIGRIGLLMFVPHVSLEVFRYSHMIHHRFTNDPQDPDHYVNGSWWSTPLRWMTFDLYYAWYNATSTDPRGRKTLKQTLPYCVATVIAVAVLCYLGYGREVLLLWLIPSRITLALIAFVFLWMPHLDGDAHGRLTHISKAASTTNNLTAGTTMRIGREGLLRPLMQWHNYHLIHHLWPTTPSYNHEAVWRLMEPELRERDLRIQHGFDLVPTFHPGGTTSPAAR